MTPETLAYIRTHAQSHIDDGTTCKLGAHLLVELIDELLDTSAKKSPGPPKQTGAFFG